MPPRVTSQSAFTFRLPAPGRPKLLPQVHLNAAGIDGGAPEPFVAVPDERDPSPGRSLGTFTADLLTLADGLEQCGIDTVATESPGVDGIPLYERLDARGFTVKRVEPGKLKMIAGRKTAGFEGPCIRPLHTCGLLQGACRPDDQRGVRRSDRRRRDRLVRDAAQHLQPRFHVRQSLVQMTGVDLMTIDGCRTGSLVLDLLAEIGMDLRPWPPEKPFCAWLCWFRATSRRGAG